jgi:hypothetical protein
MQKSFSDLESANGSYVKWSRRSELHLGKANSADIDNRVVESQ